MEVCWCVDAGKDSGRKGAAWEIRIVLWTKVVMIIDEYDVPLDKAWQEGGERKP